MKLQDNRNVVEDAVAAGTLSGAVILTWRRGKIVQFDTIGMRNVADALPMEHDTIFRLASMGKVITDAAAMSLSEDGVLSLDDPITRWCPEFTDIHVLDCDDDVIDGIGKTVPARREITIRDLLTNRSGLGYKFTTTGALQAAYAQVSESGLDEFIADLSRIPLLCQPGERMTFGHHTDVLAVVLTRATGETLQAILDSRILGPLQMVDTGLSVPESKQHRVAGLYRPRSGKLVANRQKIPSSFPRFYRAGDALFSTASDFLQFARMMMGKGEIDGVRVLSRESVELMEENTLSDAEQQDFFLGVPLWLGKGFGMNVFVVTDPDVHSFFAWPASRGSVGWLGGYGTLWQVDRDHDLIFIYLTQDERAFGAALETGSITKTWWEDLMALPFGTVMRTYRALAEDSVVHSG